MRLTPTLHHARALTPTKVRYVSGRSGSATAALHGEPLISRKEERFTQRQNVGRNLP